MTLANANFMGHPAVLRWDNGISHACGADENSTVAGRVARGLVAPTANFSAVGVVVNRPYPPCWFDHHGLGNSACDGWCAIGNTLGRVHQYMSRYQFIANSCRPVVRMGRPDQHPLGIDAMVAGMVAVVPAMAS